MSRIWIVRHGDTFAPGETPRRIGIRTDLPLVESGRAQARALADWFAGEGVRLDRVLSSPLRRTWETAETIAAGVGIEPADWLAEIDHGPDEGQPEPAVVVRIGADALAAWDRDGIAPDGWIVDRQSRIAGWRALLADTRDDEQIAVVTSNGAARFALAANPGLERDATALPRRKLRTGAFGMVSKKAAREWRIEAWDWRP